MSRKVKNILLILGVAVLSAGMLMGCGKTSEKKSAEKELQEMGFTKDEAEDILELAAEFADVEANKEEESKAEKEEDSTGLEICECMITDKDIFYDIEFQYLDMVFTPGMTYEDVVNTISKSKFAKYIKLEYFGEELGPYSKENQAELVAIDENGNELDKYGPALVFSNSYDEIISSGCVKDWFLGTCDNKISDYVWLPGGISNATINEWDYDKCTSWNGDIEEKGDNFGVYQMHYWLGDEIYEKQLWLVIQCDETTGYGKYIADLNPIGASNWNSNYWKEEYSNTDLPRY